MNSNKNNITTLAHILVLCCLPIFIFSQNVRWEFLKPEITNNGQVYLNGGMGGLNSPLFSNVHLDVNGLQDLYAFDRMGNIHLGFLRDTFGSTHLIYNYNNTTYFPASAHWARMMDIDKDTVPDLICGDPLNSGKVNCWFGLWENGVLVFEPFINERGGRELLYKSASGYIPIVVAESDLPSISDNDYDGDIDILTFDENGEHVLFFKNTSTDSLGPTQPGQKPCFVLEDECWGKFLEDGSGQGVAYGLNDKTCAVGFTDPNTESPIHNGACITAFDVDRDQDEDLFLGDPSSLFLSILINNGSNSKAYVSDQENQFPQKNNAVIMRYLPAVSVVDFDQNGYDDLIVTPFSLTGEDINVASLFLRDISSWQNLKSEKSFSLVDDIFDCGYKSAPSLIDINGDGLLDLVVGIGNVFDPNASDDAKLILLINTSTPTSIAFKVENENYLDLPSRSFFESDYVPTWADVDEDGDKDLLMGSGSGKIYFGENVSLSPDTVIIDTIIKSWFDIDLKSSLGSNTSVVWYDVDQDGLSDLLIGENHGNINFLKNIGHKGEPNFNHDISDPQNFGDYGLLNETKILRDNGGASISEWTKDGKDYLIVSNNLGDIAFAGLKTIVLPSNEIILSAWQNLRIGHKSHIVVGDIDLDGDFESIIGNGRGGLNFFNVDDLISSQSDLNIDQLSIYPNPNSGTLYLHLSIDSRIIIRHINGRIITDRKVLSGHSSINLSEQKPGIYIVEAHSPNGIAIQKLIKL